MVKVEDVAKTIAKLAHSELAKFRTWFEAFDAGRFDEKIEKAAKNGALDGLAETALSDLRAARCHAFP
jgi:hypothetical protein